MNDNLPVSGPSGAPRIIARSDHPISRSSVSQNALRVLYRLKEAGFEAFLVGGCVRDIMLGHEPKDFDVATNALPEEVRRLFRNCRLVGRRFRLAHVVFGHDVIEVATFRASNAPAQSEDPTREEEAEADAEIGEAEVADAVEAEDEPAGESRGTDRLMHASGRILRDNIYGSIGDDVWRRDFTANALYYNIADFSVWDYVGGAEDIAARRLRLIGDPATRYREDPVRMLRAARFEAKLDFELEPASLAPIATLRHLLAEVPPARLFDETAKLFLTGHGVASLRVLRRHRLLEILLPEVERYLRANPDGLVEQLLVRGLANTDERVATGKPVTPTYLLALLLYGPIAAAIEQLPPQRWHESTAISEACDVALRQAQQRLSIPKRVFFGVRDLFALQPRLEHPRGRRALRLLEQPRFRAAFDLLQLRASLGLASAEVSDWWAKLQETGIEQREQMVDAAPAPAAAAGEGEGPDTTSRPRRRRRRRGGRGGGGSSGGGGGSAG